MPVEVEIIPNTGLIRRGHRIRVDIAALHRRRAREPARLRRRATTTGARNTIHTGPEHPSYVQLPVLPARDQSPMTAVPGPQPTTERDADDLEELLPGRRSTTRLLRYCRGLDRVDMDVGRSAFHQDAWIDFPASLHVGRSTGSSISWPARCRGSYARCTCWATA